MKRSIANLILVEGPHDKNKLISLFDCNVLVLRGYEIAENLFAFLDKAQKTNRILVMTDPDDAGREIATKIESRLNNYVDVCLPISSIKKKKKGVAESSNEIIFESLFPYSTDERLYSIARDDLIKAGLIGNLNSKENRLKIASKLSLLNRNLNDFVLCANVLKLKYEDLI